MHRAPLWTGRERPTSVRTVILSPDTIFAEALSMCLSGGAGIDVVGLALEPAAAESAVGALQPEVLVCDQRSVGPELADGLARARARQGGLRTVLVSTMPDPAATQAPAFDAVVPPRSSLDRVVAAVREVVWSHPPRPPVAAPPGEVPPGLSRRELEVLHLLARGTSTRAIASQLHLSQHTVRNHVRRLTAKLGVRSRLEAVTEGRRLGYL